MPDPALFATFLFATFLFPSLVVAVMPGPDLVFVGAQTTARWQRQMARAMGRRRGDGTDGKAWAFEPEGGR